jgi:hypothetical protein
MGFFSRHRAAAPPPAFSTGHPGDDQVLGLLAAHRDLSSPRHWVHYLYFPDEASATSWAASIEASGWTLQAVEPAATGDGQWVVIPERHEAIVSPDAVKNARAYFEAVAAQVKNAEYDGWVASN